MYNATKEEYGLFDYGEYELVEGTNNLEDLPEVRDNYHMYHIEYLQSKVSNSSCSIHAPIGVVSNLFGYKYTTEEIKEIWNKAQELGAKDPGGWTMSGGVDLVRNEWNKENPDKKTRTFKVKTGSPMFWELINKGYMGVCGGRFNNGEYIKDKRDNDVVETDKLSYTTYGHLLYFVKSNRHYIDGIKVDIEVIDSFDSGDGDNMYGLDSFNQKVLNGMFFQNTYFFIPEDVLKMEKLRETLTKKEKTYLEILKKVNSIIWNKIEIEELREQLHKTNNLIRTLLD